MKGFLKIFFEFKNKNFFPINILAKDIFSYIS